MFRDRRWKGQLGGKTESTRKLDGYASQRADKRQSKFCTQPVVQAEHRDHRWRQPVSRKEEKRKLSSVRYHPRTAPEVTFADVQAQEEIVKRLSKCPAPFRRRSEAPAALELLYKS